MIRSIAAALIAAAGAIAEILVPGHALYHSGWYNVGLGALVIVAIAAGRKVVTKQMHLRVRIAIAAIALGAAATGLAGIVNGLFAPDDRTVRGVPGERVAVEGLGELVFPLSEPESGAPVPVRLERSFHAPLEIGARPRNTGNFILRSVPRSVVYVQAEDARGNRLTITQPEGTVFLSPVLLMQHRQTIAGLDLPFDSFNVPAARRIVKAILFSPAQAAVMLHEAGTPGQSAVLLAVDDENDRPLPHAIGLSPNGRPVRLGGLVLRAVVADYPQVEVVSAPNAIAVTIGALAIAVGLVTLALRR